MAALAAERERQPVGVPIDFGDDAAGVEIVGDQPLIDQGERDRARRAGEGLRGRTGVAEAGLEGEIAVPLRPHRRSSRRERGGGADHMGQRLPVDGDRLGGVLGVRNRIRNHEGNGIAHMTHLITRQHRIGRDRDGGFGDKALARQVAERGGIGAGQHQGDPGHRAGLRHVGDRKARMRVRRAQHDRFAQPGRRVIGDIAAGAAQEAIILQPCDRLADAEFDRLHSYSAGAVRLGSGRARLARWAIHRAIT